MATLLGSLLVSLGLESGEFKSGLSAAEKDIRKATRNIERMGDKIGNFGQKMTVGVTAPMALLAKKAVEGFIDQEKAMADVTSALKSMGNASGKTAKELGKTADELEMNSLYDADVILKQVTANLLTFGNVANREFDRAQQAAIDMATRLGQDPQSSAIMLGKALNDPIKGITALTRVGVQFTDQQKAQIKAMTEAGDVAGAQGIILEEVERQFKGAAAAAADATPWRKAQVAIGQAMDVIGEAILPIIEPVAEAVASMARAFANLSEPMQKAVVIGAALAAALGPVLMVVGPLVSAMAPFIGTLKVIGAQQGAMAAIRGGIVGIASAFGPMIAVAGIAYAVWKNWDDIAPRLQPLIDQITAIGEGLGLLEVDASKTQAELAKDDGWRQFGVKLRETSDWLQQLADDFDDYNARSAKAARENGTTIQAMFSKMWQSFDQWWTGLKATVARIPSELKAIGSQLVDVGRNMIEGLVRGIKSAPGAVKNALVGVASDAVASAKAFLGIRSPSRVFMEIGGFIAEGLAIGIESGEGRVRSAAQKIADAAKQTALETKALIDRLFPDVRETLDYRKDLALIDGSKLSDDAKDEARKRLGREVSGRSVIGGEKWEVSQKLMDSKPLTDGMDKVSTALKGLGDRAAVQTVRVADSFKDMAEKAMQSLSGLAQAIKGGGFLDILSSALQFGLQLGSMGVFGKQFASRVNKVPAYAGGTNFHPGGMALVGEDGPEYVNLPRGSQVFSNRESMAMAAGKLQVEVIANNNGFGAIIRDQAGRVLAEAAPAMMDGAAKMGVQRMAQMQSRQL